MFGPVATYGDTDGSQFLNLFNAFNEPVVEHHWNTQSQEITPYYHPPPQEAEPEAEPEESHHEPPTPSTTEVTQEEEDLHFSSAGKEVMADHDTAASYSEPPTTTTNTMLTEKENLPHATALLSNESRLQVIASAVDDFISAPMPQLGAAYLRVVGESARQQTRYYFVPEIIKDWALLRRARGRSTTDLMAYVDQLLSRVVSSGEAHAEEKRLSLLYLKWALAEPVVMTEMERLLYVVQCFAEEEDRLTVKSEAVARHYFFSHFE